MEVAEKTLGKILVERIREKEKDEFKALVDKIKADLERLSNERSFSFPVPQYHLQAKIKEWLISQDIPFHDSHKTQPVYHIFHNNGTLLAISVRGI